MTGKISDNNLWDLYVRPALEGKHVSSHANEVLSAIKPGKFGKKFKSEYNPIEDEYFFSNAYFLDAMRYNDSARIYAAFACGMNMPDDIRDNVLLWAAITNHKDMIALLLAKGANINTFDVEDRTPLHTAVKEYNNDMVALLLAKGANVNTVDSEGHTPLHDAGHTEIASLLLEKGANIEAKDIQSSFTPLHYAAMGDNYEMAALLLEKGANIEAKDKGNWTPLHYAASNDAYETAALLLKKGADVDAREKDGETPLHRAIENNATDVATLLVENGADMAAEDKIGWTPLDHASSTDSMIMIKTLLRAGAGTEYSVEDTQNAIDECLKDMRHHAFKTFKLEPTRAHYFDANRKISIAVLDACAIDQFVPLIGAPLLTSDDPDKRALLNEVWDKLPQHWQDYYAAFHVEMFKAKPAVGKHTADAAARSAPRGKGGRE